MNVATCRRRASRPAALFLATAFAIATSAFAQAPVPPSGVRAFDTPNDSGDTITILWDRAEDEGPDLRYRVLAAEGAAVSLSSLQVIDEFPSSSHTVREVKRPWWTEPADPDAHVYYVRSGKRIEVKSGVPYTVTIAAVRGGEEAIAGAMQAVAVANWFNWNALNNLLFGIAFGVVVLLSIRRAQRGPVFLRYIPGLAAVDEAIGRSTELGKPVMYLTGAHDMSDPSTVAAAVILGHVAKRTAAYETDLMVPHRNPITMAVCQEITRQAYYETGKPDLFREDANFFITSDQFSYTASVDGIMLRTKPAANFFMGAYFAEALLLTETGASTGAIQIAGTDSDHQLPFFVTTCDYTLIGEELYAASAYLSREPVQVGTLLGQDLGKLTVLTLIALGSIAATVAAGFDYEWPRLFLDMIRDVK